MMKELVETCLDCIDNSTIKQLNFECDNDVYIVDFTENSCNYSFRFYRRLFGLFSGISLAENGLYIIKESRLNKRDYMILRNKFKERIDSLNQSKFNTIFKNINLNNKLKKIIS